MVYLWSATVPPSRGRRNRSLKVTIRNELAILIAATVFLVVTVVLFPDNALQIVLGVLFLLFFPGYAVMAALFPRAGNPDAIERIVLSLAASIALGHNGA